jgi:hypothetical protein
VRGQAKAFEIQRLAKSPELEERKAAAKSIVVLRDVVPRVLRELNVMDWAKEPLPDEDQGHNSALQKEVTRARASPSLSLSL